MSSYEYNCNKLEQLRNVFDQINNKNNVAYNNKYYDLPFNNEVIDIVYFGSIFNSNKYTKISEFNILDARIKLGVDYKKYSLIPLFKSNKSEYVVYNYNISKYQLYLVGKVNEENYNQLSTDNNVIIEDLGVVYLKILEEDFDINQIVDKEKLLSKHNEYQEKSKVVYNAILNNEYLGKILKTSFYIDLPKSKNVERCEKVGNEVANILNDLVPIKQDQNNDVELIIRQKMLFGMLDIAKIRNDVFTAYVKHLKENKN